MESITIQSMDSNPCWTGFYHRFSIIYALNRSLTAVLRTDLREARTEARRLVRGLLKQP